MILHAVVRGQVGPDDVCLVIGAGPIGLLVAMALRSSGNRLILTDIAESRIAMATELGLTDAINTRTRTVGDSRRCLDSSGVNR